MDKNSDWLKEVLCCPECKSPLRTVDQQLVCPTKGCNYHSRFDGNVFHLLPPILDDCERNEDIYRKRLVAEFTAAWHERPGIDMEKLIVFNQITYYDFYSQFAFFRDEFVPRSELVGRGLELGGGAGQASGFIKLFYPHTSMVMSDIAPVNIELAVQLSLSMGFSTNYFVLANTEHLPFVENTFDFVFSSGMLHHIGELSQALKSVRAVLKTGGLWYVINEPAIGALFRPIVNSAIGPAGKQARLAHVRENSYTFQEWQKYFKEAGFDIAEQYWHRNAAHKLESWWRAAYYAGISHLPTFCLEWGLPCEVNFVLRKV